MAKIIRYSIMILLLLPLTILIASEPTEVTIDISKFAGRKVNIIVSDFADESDPAQTELALKVSGIIKNDLVMSGMFNIVEGADDLVQNEQADFTQLSNIGVDAFIKGAIDFNQEKMQLKCFLYDVSTQKRILGLNYKGTKPLFRKIIHDFSNEVIFRYTGTKGIAHTKIAFVAGIDVDKTKEVYVVDYDGYNVRRLTRDRSLALLPKWSPDGTKILFTSYKDFNPDLFILDVNRGSKRPISRFQGLNAMGQFSKDGKYIALVLSKDGNPEIYLLNDIGTIVRRLTTNKSIESSPCWSPNSREIAFVSDRSGVPQIYITDIDGINMRRLTHDSKYNDSPDWSPKGDRIVYVTRNNREFNIFTTDINGDSVQQLTVNSGRNENPSFSPDGRFIVFTSDRNGMSELYIMNADGTNQRPLLPDALREQLKAQCYTPSWSP